jgi:predicted membrane-bound spermidine synthase
MKLARTLVVFSYGLFSISAQALIFREFLGVFEGNDIGVGAFFGSWLLWVAAGAALAGRWGRLSATLQKRVELVFLAYLPAFVVQLVLILYTRQLLGVEPYALFPMKLLLAGSLLVNAPISLVTGVFFPVACRWVCQDDQLPVSRVYLTEAAGGFVGGLGATVLLAWQISSARIFFILSVIVGTSVFLVQLARTGKWRGIVLPAGILVCLLAGADEVLLSKIRLAKWSRLLPAEGLTGSFQTGQAEYLYGTYRGQWVVMSQGSVCEAVPEKESAGRIAAIGLCQNPAAGTVMVIGGGLGVCEALLKLGQMRQVLWAHYDGQYVGRLLQAVPDELKIKDERFRPFAGEVRLLAGQATSKFDIVIVNLPDATSSVLNRYFTLEFYRQIRSLLRPGGVLQVRVSGGENIMGTELVSLGASTKATLQEVFGRTVIVPGEDTWFLAGDSADLAEQPGELVDRFAGIPGARQVFPPEGLLSVYRPERASAALDSYRSADLPRRLLINRDARPLANLYSLLLAAKQSGAPVARFVKRLAGAGVWVFSVPLLVFAVLRPVYVLTTRRLARASGFDSSFLVFSAGFAGIGVAIVLMYMYQMRFGSLYLHIGVISSLFMVGLTVGAALIRSLLRRWQLRPGRLVFLVVPAHILVLVGVCCWPSLWWQHLTFAVAFGLTGVCTGLYFPLAARWLAKLDIETGAAASKLEMSDHLGAAVGAFVTGLVILPVLGTDVTLAVLVLLLCANLPAAVVAVWAVHKIVVPQTLVLRLRRAGFLLFGAGVCLVVCSNILAAGGGRQSSLPGFAVEALAGGLRAEAVSARLADTEKDILYYRLYDDAGHLAGYVFSSEQLAPEVRGFGGRMNLAIRTDLAGRLVSFHILACNETPAYLELLGEWRQLLKGHNLFEAGALNDVDAVTGATVSSEAILAALGGSGQRFAGGVLRQGGAGTVQAGRLAGRWRLDMQGIYLLSAFVLVFVVSFFGSFAMRLVVLVFAVAVGGVVLNSQYSSEQIAGLLSGQLPAAGLTGAFLLVVAVPVLVMLFGNYYCGYVCPFGAAQELVGCVVPGRLNPEPGNERMRVARFVKYVVLLVIIGAYFVSRNRATLQADPLIEIFSGRAAKTSVVVTTLVLAGAVFYPRFWCRYLCPAGAFLSLAGGLGVLKRLLPPKRFGSCEFGVSTKAELDCLFCDRCRYVTRKGRQLPSEQAVKPFLERLLARYVLVPVMVVAVVLSAGSVKKLQLAAGTAVAGGSAVGYPGGQSRDVDLARIRTMVEQKRLSDREAQFYRKLEQNDLPADR